MVKIFSPASILEKTIKTSDTKLTYQDDKGGYRLSDLDYDDLLLTSLYVHPEHRGNNYSAALLRHAIDNSENKSIHLTAKAFGIDKDTFDNERLIGLYERHGFKKVTPEFPEKVYNLIGTYMLLERNENGHKRRTPTLANGFEPSFNRCLASNFEETYHCWETRSNWLD